MENQAVHSFGGEKWPTSAFFHVFGGELDYFLDARPIILQGIVFSHIQLDSSQKSHILDTGGATAQIRRERVGCVGQRFIIWISVIFLQLGPSHAC